MADDAEEDGLDDATRAFEGLRGEITVLRRAVEAIEPVLRENQAPDYSPTLGALAKSLDAIASRIEAIEMHTGATVSAEVARREIARVYDASLRPARGDLERATREVLDAAHALHGAAGHTRTREEQRVWIIRTAAIGAVVGLLAVPLVVFPIARMGAIREPAGQPGGLGAQRGSLECRHGAYEPGQPGEVERLRRGLHDGACYGWRTQNLLRFRPENR